MLTICWVLRTHIPWTVDNAVSHKLSIVRLFVEQTNRTVSEHVLSSPRRRCRRGETQPWAPSRVIFLRGNRLATKNIEEEKKWRYHLLRRVFLFFLTLKLTRSLAMSLNSLTIPLRVLHVSEQNLSHFFLFSRWPTLSNIDVSSCKQSLSIQIIRYKRVIKVVKEIFSNGSCWLCLSHTRVVRKRRFPMIFHNEKHVYWHWIIHFWKA
jgi:hypothetical protein